MIILKDTNSLNDQANNYKIGLSITISNIKIFELAWLFDPPLKRLCSKSISMIVFWS